MEKPQGHNPHCKEIWGKGQKRAERSRNSQDLEEALRLEGRKPWRKWPGKPRGGKRLVWSNP